jgi:hypothetical protein
MLKVKSFAAREHDRSLDGACQLADVSRPWRGRKHAQRIIAD